MNTMVAMDGLSPPAGAIKRSEIVCLYQEYYEALDDVKLDQWPEFFTEACLYRVIPRENFEKGYTLCTIQAESRAMLKDRVTGLTRTQMYAPRYYRRFPTAPRICGYDCNGEVATRHNLLLVQTLLDKASVIILSAVCHDRIVKDGTRLRFRERIVVFDSEMILNSFVYPA